jgi:hypothetical protein
MQDVLFTLRGISEDRAAGGEKDQSKRVARHKKLVWMLAAAVVILSAGSWMLWRRASLAAGNPPIRFPIFAPETATWTPSDGVIVSPDGRRFAFVASLADGKPILWVRLLDALSLLTAR